MKINVHRLLYFLMVLIPVISYGNGDIEIVSEEEGSLYCEQKVRFKPPIVIAGKKVHYAKIRSVISVATPDGSRVTLHDRGVSIYVGDNPRDSIKIIHGTNDPLTAISLIPQLNGYNTQRVKNFAEDLDEKFKNFNFGATIGGMKKIKVVVPDSGARNY